MTIAMLMANTATGDTGLTLRRTPPTSSIAAAVRAARVCRLGDAGPFEGILAEHAVREAVALDVSHMGDPRRRPGRVALC
jgi:hypothetical protein